MIYDQILVRFGDLTLKGKNQKDFFSRLIRFYRILHINTRKNTELLQHFYIS